MCIQLVTQLHHPLVPVHCRHIPTFLALRLAVPLALPVALAAAVCTLRSVPPASQCRQPHILTSSHTPDAWQVGVGTGLRSTTGSTTPTTPQHGHADLAGHQRGRAWLSRVEREGTHARCHTIIAT